MSSKVSYEQDLLRYLSKKQEYVWRNHSTKMDMIEILSFLELLGRLYKCQLRSFYVMRQWNHPPNS